MASGQKRSDAPNESADQRPEQKKSKNRDEQPREDPENGPPRASLLGLPAEIRNEIYRLSVVESENILLSETNTVQPGLLRCNRQLQSECRPIYLSENKFSVQIRDLKLAPQKQHWLWNDQLVEVEPSFQLDGPDSWTNFKAWLKDCAEDGTPLYRFGHQADEVSDEGSFSPLAYFFDIVKEMKGLPWEQIDKVLELSKTAMFLARHHDFVFDP